MRIAWRDSSDGWQCADRDVRFDSWEKGLRMVFARCPANLWNVFTRFGDDGAHREAVTSRPLLQSCVARLSRHARQGIVTIYTATSKMVQEIYRAISSFLSVVASASQLSLEERRQRIIAHAFRKYGTVRRLFPPDIGGQMTMPFV